MPDPLAARLRAGETLLTAWSAIPDALVAETCARAGFDAVTLDMQHGFHGVDSVLRGIGAVRLGGAPAIVRIPVGDFAFASRALDMGATAVIAPMINSVDDARAFAEAMKFPPIGGRSWGPNRAVALTGAASPQTYLESANADTLSLAMVETRQAVDILDQILAVDGIDGVFVGPADFSIAWTGGKTVDPTLEDMMTAIAEIAAKTRHAGKIAATLALDGVMAKRYAGMGFRLIAINSDVGYLTAGAKALIASFRS
jgi:4-hydroxy-2-oxoheptanedioate aldolase